MCKPSSHEASNLKETSNEVIHTFLGAVSDICSQEDFNHF